MGLPGLRVQNADRYLHINKVRMIFAKGIFDSGGSHSMYIYGPEIESDHDMTHELIHFDPTTVPATPDPSTLILI